MQVEASTLVTPVSEENPCGEDLDAAQPLVLAAFDGYRVFGQMTPWSKDKQPDWREIRDRSLEVLRQSRDLRVLAHLATAGLHTEGLGAFGQTLEAAKTWLSTWWDAAYPRIDEDAILRRNALNCFADPMAVVDRIWRLPLVESRQHGRFGLRDIELARGQATPGPLEAKPDEAAIRAAFGEMPMDELTTLDRSVADAMAALNAIDARMRSEGGPDVAPDFGPLSTQFAKLNRFLREQVESRTAAGAAAGAGADGAAVGAAFAVGGIASRQDAIRALDAVAEYFRRNEPSSPIPLFVDRAKRLVAKDFLEVLADIAPDALAVARSAGGLKDEQ